MLKLFVVIILTDHENAYFRERVSLNKLLFTGEKYIKKFLF